MVDGAAKNCVELISVVAVVVVVAVALYTSGKSVVVPVCVTRRMMSPATASSMKKAMVTARFMYRLLGTTCVSFSDMDRELCRRAEKYVNQN